MLGKVDGLGVAAELDLLLDPGTVRFARGAGQLRWPSRGPGWGNLLPENRVLAAVGAGGTPGEFAPPAA